MPTIKYKVSLSENEKQHLQALIRVVLDNLNTHKVAFLYEAFPAGQGSLCTARSKPMSSMQCEGHASQMATYLVRYMTSIGSARRFLNASIRT